MGILLTASVIVLDEYSIVDLYVVTRNHDPVANSIVSWCKKLDDVNIVSADTTRRQIKEMTDRRRRR